MTALFGGLVGGHAAVLTALVLAARSAARTADTLDAVLRRGGGRAG